MAERILVVEDAVSVREVILEYLAGEGYACDGAGTAAEGLALLKANSYELLLTDLRLPDRDGNSLIEAVGELQPHAVKLLMSAHGDLEDALRGIRLGAYDFVQKPFRRMEELGHAVSRALERRRLAAEQERSHAEIRRLNTLLEEEVCSRTEELSRANQELRTLDEMKNNLLANISHELRTPLVSVRGYTELFYSGRLCPIPEEYRKYLQTSLRNIDKLLSLIESLVRYAELARAQDVRLALETIDLGALAESLAAAVAPLAAAEKVTVRVHKPDAPLRVRADRERLREAAWQLVQNAVKFNRPEGEVILQVDRLGQQLAKVSVRDTGIGIAIEEQARIFERFYQIDSGPTRQHGGTGIGLTIARDNMRLMGSEILVSSELGRGSTFYFSMPLAAGEPPAA